MRRSLFFSLGIFFVSIVSCQSQQGVQKQPSLATLEQDSSLQETQELSYESIRIKKLQQEFDAEHFTDTNSEEAFLIAQNLEQKKSFKEAEKLYSFCFKHAPNLTVGIHLVQVQLYQKKYSEAEQLSQYLVVAFPNKITSILNLIEVYQFTENTSGFQKVLNKAYINYPNSEAIVIYYSLSLNDRSQSKGILNKFLKKNTHSYQAILALAKIYYQEKNYIESKKYINNAFKFDSDNQDAILLMARTEQMLKNYQNAEIYYRKIFERDRNESFNTLQYIKVLMQLDKNREALFLLLKLESTTDKNLKLTPEFSIQLVRVLMTTHHYQQALSRLLVMKENNSSDFDQNEVGIYIASCYLNLKEYDKALKQLNLIYPTKDFFFDIQREKSLVYLNKQDFKSAKELINSFKITKKDAVNDYLFKTSVLLFLGQTKEASSFLNQGILDYPNEKSLELKKIDILRKKSFNQSIKELHGLLKRWPNDPELMNYLGYSLIDQSTDLIYAEKLLQKALKKEPHNYSFLDSLAWLYYKKGDFEKANTFSRKSVLIGLNDPSILYHWGMIKEARHEIKDALDLYKQAQKTSLFLLPFDLKSDDELWQISKILPEKITTIQGQI